MSTTAVIIGAGPAGMAAAEMLVHAGLHPTVLDEGGQPGGQIFRKPQAQLQRPLEKLYGFDAARARRVNATFASLRSKIDYRPGIQVWAVGNEILHLIDDSGSSVQAWTHLIVAPGAMDRIAPVRGWTAVGLYSLGGAQIALKAEAAVIGRRVIFAGSGPLLYLVAYQYAEAGVDVAAVLETGHPFAQIARLPALLSGGRLFARGLYYMAALRKRGIPILTGVRLQEVIRDSDDRVTALSFRHRGMEQVESCDAVALGHGLRSETQLADLLDIEFSFDAVQRQWLPKTDQDGRSTASNIYLAGDGLSIRGSEIAEASGRLAASALLHDIGLPAPSKVERDRRTMRSAARFREALERTFAYPHEEVAALPDDVVVCRCEGLSAGAIRQTVERCGEADINRVKAFCRVGMGRCQGRLCGAAAAEIVAAASGTTIESVGRMRGQAPIKPIPLAELVRSRP